MDGSSMLHSRFHMRSLSILSYGALLIGSLFVLFLLNGPSSARVFRAKTRCGSSSGVVPRTCVHCVILCVQRARVDHLVAFHDMQVLNRGRILIRCRTGLVGVTKPALKQLGIGGRRRRQSGY